MRVGAAVCAALTGLRCEARAQRLVEAGVGATVVAARQSFAGVGAVVASRSGQALLDLTTAFGEAAGSAAVRISGAAAFLLWPSTRGRTPYAGLGLAAVGARGLAGAAYLTAVVGVEAAPAGRRGWYVEAGLGGGVWAAAGIRWRHPPA